MRKTILLLAVACLPIFANSQVKFGVQGGFTFSRAEMSYKFLELQPGYLLGPMAGAMIGVNLGDGNFSLMQEFNYVSKGAKIEGTDKTTGTPVSIRRI